VKGSDPQEGDSMVWGDSQPKIHDQKPAPWKDNQGGGAVRTHKLGEWVSVAKK